MNAMEHGNHYQADLPVHIQVLRSPEHLVVRIIDHGGEAQINRTRNPGFGCQAGRAAVAPRLGSVPHPEHGR